MKLTHKFIHFCFPLLITITIVSESAAQTRWYKVVSPDKEFTVEFPSEPEYLFRPNPDTGYGTGVFRIIFKQYALEVSYQDVILSLKTDRDIAQFIDRTKDWQFQAWKKLGIKRTRLEDLPSGGYESDGYGNFNDGRSKYLRVRTYFRGTRLYIMSCTSWSPSGIGGEIVNRFLDSFRFTAPVIGKGKGSSRLSK